MKILIIVFLFFKAGVLSAQVKLGNNPTSTNTDALLELESNNKGFLLPRVLLSAANSSNPLTSHLAGMTVYNTASSGTGTNAVTPGVYINNGSRWIKVVSDKELFSFYNSNGNLTGNRTIRLNNNRIQFDNTATSNNNHFSIDGNTLSIDALNNNIGIGTITPLESAIVEVNSITKGFLPPRLTNARMKAIVAPQNGLMFYNTTLKCMAYYIDSSFSCTYNNPILSAPLSPLGSSYTSFSNGTANFSTNASCINKPISAQGCAGLIQIIGQSGTVYPLVDINGQCWFQTNLKEVPSNFTFHKPSSWLSSSVSDSGYWGFYNSLTVNGSAGWALTEPASDEGFLYQWSAAMDNSLKERSRGLCPYGFHIPSDCEWMYLEHGLGMSVTNQRASNWRSSGTVGSNLSNYTSSGTNSSGFTALLVGQRATNGTFSSRSNASSWWSSTQTSTTNASMRGISDVQVSINRQSTNKSNSFSVRCLKD